MMMLIGCTIKKQLRNILIQFNINAFISDNTISYSFRCYFDFLNNTIIISKRCRDTTKAEKVLFVSGLDYESKGVDFIVTCHSVKDFRKFERAWENIHGNISHWTWEENIEHYFKETKDKHYA